MQVMHGLLIVAAPLGFWAGRAEPALGTPQVWDAALPHAPVGLQKPIVSENRTQGLVLSSCRLFQAFTIFLNAFACS